MAKPCECPHPNPECTRSGQPMVGRLWELCSGSCPSERPCSQEMSEAYRTRWDRHAGRRGVCKFLGEAVRGPDGKAVTREMALE